MFSKITSKGILAAVAFVAAALGVISQAAAGLPECSPSSRLKINYRCKPAPVDQPPIISGAPASTVTTGETYAFRPTASDPEGKTLTFSVANKPAWASFSSTTGRLSGTPTSSAVGEYIDIRVNVSDGRTTTTLAPYSIAVLQANRAPKLTGTPPTAGREGQVYEFKPVATDADGDSLSFSITNRPAWATFSSATGVLKGTPGTGSVGTYANIAIRVSDGEKAASLPAFSIGVQQASMGSATLSWQAPTSRIDGSPLLNLAGYWVRYGTVSGSYPNQVKIANPGVTSYVITNLPAGKYYFVATAYDAQGRESQFSGVASKTIG